jgi:hypothetical protein
LKKTLLNTHFWAANITKTGPKSKHILGEKSKTEKFRNLNVSCKKQKETQKIEKCFHLALSGARSKKTRG